MSSELHRFLCTLFVATDYRIPFQWSVACLFFKIDVSSSTSKLCTIECTLHTVFTINGCLYIVQSNQNFVLYKRALTLVYAEHSSSWTTSTNPYRCCKYRIWRHRGIHVRLTVGCQWAISRRCFVWLGHKAEPPLDRLYTCWFFT